MRCRDRHVRVSLCCVSFAFALLVVLAFLLLGLVVALASPETGKLEKPVLVLAIVGPLAAGVPVRRIAREL